MLLNATEFNSLSGSTYQWYKNNNIISNATTSEYAVNGVGTYKVILTLGNGNKASNEVAINTYTTSVTKGKTYLTAMGTMENGNKCLLKGKYSSLTKEIPYDSNTCNLTIANNLVLNGNFEYKDTSHFFEIYDDNMIYNSSSNNLYLPAMENFYYFGEKIKIDSNLRYEISMTTKGNIASTLNREHLIGIVEYDCRGDSIRATNIMYIAGSTTTLAQDLKKGDTVVYLNDTSGFYADNNTPSYQRGFIFWNYKDCDGNDYGVETYSRNFYHNLYTYNNINKINNTITLNSAWNYDTIPAGTSLSQSSSGESYNYALGFVLPTTYTKLSKVITGRGKNNSYIDKFRYGTEYIQPFINTNYYTNMYNSTFIESYIKEISVQVVE